MTKKAWGLLLLTMAVAVGLAACSSNEGTTQPADVADTTEAPVSETVAGDEVDTEAQPTTAPEPAISSVQDETSVSTPELQPVEPQSIEPSSPVEPAGEDLISPEGAFAGASEALAELNSYRYTTVFSFVGEEDGEVEAGSIELSGVVAGPDEKHLIWTSLEDEERFEIIQLGQRAWVLSDGAWEEAPVLVAEAMSQAVLIYAPSVAWGGVFGELEPTATYVGKATVNGVSAYHYTSTFEQWGGYWPGQLENAAGDVWIAEAGYPVKYEFSATGVDEEGDSATILWRMDLVDANRELTIEPPGSGSAGM